MVRITSLVLLLVCPLFLGASNVQLYLEPDLATDVLAELAPDDGQLALAEPVLDEERRAEGWYWFEYDGTVMGYVENEQIGKDLQVNPGALVYLRPSRTSPILAMIQAADKTELISAGDWVRIRFSKVVPVYFQRLPEIGLQPPASGSALPTQGEGKALEIEPGSRGAVISGGPVGESRSRYFEGTLEPTRWTIAGEPKYRYQLLDSDGRRTAYVITENLLIASSPDRFIGKEVTIYGEATALKKSRTIVINARTLRLK